jgi:hypothetical protein
MEFPELRLANWIATRDTLHGYAKAVGMVRKYLMPKQKHWWHITLHVGATGLTTTPIPFENRTVELLLDHLDHEVAISTNHNERIRIPLEGQSPANVLDDLIQLLSDIDINIQMDADGLIKTANIDYDHEAVTNYWLALSQIDGVFKKFKGNLREETGPVHVFPHHFDLSMNWFSGNMVPNVDPDDEENADEQMNFGFVSGDEGIKDAYFYITAYPNPDGWGEFKLPEYASWHRQDWVGCIMMYEDMRKLNEPAQKLSTFFNTVHAAGKKLMNAGS